ncbi:MAG: glutamate--tRNA ligase [Clostridia bacterium]|nr:glutamate--tRNA ligase [Clostridia bacterium]
MNKGKVRTRFEPSPTGFMHIGNLRTALYEYLIAKSNDGMFILRIEDTDKGRYVCGAVDIIYNTLKTIGLKHDEGPDIGGAYGPYIQSERKSIYLDYAQRLIKEDKAYYCFCTKERLASLNKNGEDFSGYDRHCRDLPKEEVQSLLEKNVPYVIRQKIPMAGETTFVDEVYGEITVQNKEIEDQILIKADLYPTYNFANVVDDHLMDITHVVRGSEYLSSTPKYNLLYEAFGWAKPIYVHLPLIMGKNEDGSTSKLSKRHGSVSFEDLVNDGYLPEAIINYVALLGWCPKENREIYSLEDLQKAFSIDRIVKSPSIFDYDKLTWFNGEYIRNKPAEEFVALAKPYLQEALDPKIFDFSKIASILHQRVTKLAQIPEMVDFFPQLPEYSIDLFINKKSKATLENAPVILKQAIVSLSNIKAWDHDSIHDSLIDLANTLGLKNGTVMWPVRIAASGKAVTPGGAIEILEILGKEETLRRLNFALEKFENHKLGLISSMATSYE